MIFTVSSPPPSTEDLRALATRANRRLWWGSGGLLCAMVLMVATVHVSALRPWLEWVSLALAFVCTIVLVFASRLLLACEVGLALHESFAREIHEQIEANLRAEVEEGFDEEAAN